MSLISVVREFGRVCPVPLVSVGEFPLRRSSRLQFCGQAGRGSTCKTSCMPGSEGDPEVEFLQYYEDDKVEDQYEELKGQPKKVHQ